MSFILDALKKADRERNLSKVPTFTTVHIPVYATGRRVAVWAVAGALLGGAALVWWLQPSAEAPVSTVQPRPSAAVNPPARLTDRERGPASGAVANLPPTVLPESVPPWPSVAPRPGDRRQADRDRTVRQRPNQPAPKPLPQPPTAPIQPEIRETRPVELDAPVLPSRRPEAQPSVEASRTPSLVIPAPPPVAPPAPATPRPEAQPPLGANRSPAVVIPAAAPPAPPAQPTLREALSKMTLDVFVYTDVEVDRMVVINGRRYVKGQLVDGLFLVEAINPDGVVLTYRDERAVLHP